MSSGSLKHQKGCQTEVNLELTLNTKKQHARTGGESPGGEGGP